MCLSSNLIMCCRLAASENHKETLLAEVNNLREEMEVLRRETTWAPYSP